MLAGIQKQNKKFSKLKRNIINEIQSNIPSRNGSPQPNTPPKSIPGPVNRQIDHDQDKNNRVKSHENPNDVIIDVRKNHPGTIPDLISFSATSKEMKDVAFEVVFDNDDNQNLHPLDEPLILRNGKKIYPGQPSSKISLNNREMNTVSIDDLVKFLQNTLKLLNSMVINFWNTDLHFNITISENSTLKVHIPTVVFSLVIMKILFMFRGSSDEGVYQIPKSAPSKSNVGLLPIILFILVLIIFSHYNKNNNENQIDETNNENISHLENASQNSTEAATLVGSIENKDKIKNIWKEDTPVSDTDSIFDNTPYNADCRLETLMFKNKVPLQKDFHPVHRKEQKMKNPKNKLDLNLPIPVRTLSSRSIASTTPKVSPKRRPEQGFHTMTEQGREEMLKAFNF